MANVILGIIITLTIIAFVCIWLLSSIKADELKKTIEEQNNVKPKK